MTRFTDEELHALATGHKVPRPTNVPAAVAGFAQEERRKREVRILRRFATTPAAHDGPAIRAALPHYTDLPGLARFECSARVWRSRAVEDAAPGAEAWGVTVQDDPASRAGEPAQELGPFATWAEAMDVARAEARYVVDRPALQHIQVADRVTELRDAAFATTASLEEVCS